MQQFTILVLVVLTAALSAQVRSDPKADPKADPKHDREAAARAAHWAWQPVRRPVPPRLAGARRQPGNPIDGFVRRRLAAAGLAPSPPADRRTLIRRLSFDLIGLPPTKAEVDAFLADRSPAAYGVLVDRLLASPHHGERWARHWLDVARFGESNGFEHDEPRHNAWRYRAWVVRALNADLPYDQFARAQIAGDVLDRKDPAAAIPTGFLVAGAYDAVGQKQQSAARRAIVRQDELEDIVGTTMQAFLAVTAHCARCHDHKFDPISQLEYYRLTAAFAGVRHGEREVAPRDAAAGSRRRIERLEGEIDALERPVVAAIRAKRPRAGSGEGSPGPVPFATWDFRNGIHDAVAHGKARVVDGALVLDGRGSFVATGPLSRGLGAKTLEAWVQLANLDHRGGAAISVQTLDGRVFDAIVFGELADREWQAGSDNFRRTKSFGGPKEWAARRRPVHLAIVYAADGTITAYRDGQPYGTAYRSSGVQEFEPGQAQLLIGLRHGLQPRADRLLRGRIYRVQLHDRALTAAEVARSCRTPIGAVTERELVAELGPDSARRRAKLLAELRAVQEESTALRRQRAYCAISRRPEVTHFLKRGNPALRGEAVVPGGIAALVGLSAEFGLPGDATDPARRLKLAEWISSPDNPLFSRVAVNRVWHHHFGVGIVDTPSDFGRSGGRPSHPELLDWLAAEFVRTGSSVKALHRLIVTSATYRQASRNNPAAARKDADNRLLWRMRPRRLEAEAVRDAILVVADRLDRQVGGRGYRDFKIKKRGGTHYYELFDRESPRGERRSIYRMWTRGGRNVLLDAFDCPDPSTTTPQRAVTTTPLQALSLMNNAFVLRLSVHFAKRLAREAPGGVAAQIVRAFELAFARRPTPREIDELRSIVSSHGLPALARAVINSNEFVYVH